jgi:hypothetical protein
MDAKSGDTTLMPERQENDCQGALSDYDFEGEDYGVEVALICVVAEIDNVAQDFEEPITVAGGDHL